MVTRENKDERTVSSTGIIDFRLNCWNDCWFVLNCCYLLKEKKEARRVGMVFMNKLVEKLPYLDG